MISKLPPIELDATDEALWKARDRLRSTGIAMAILWPILTFVQATLLASFTLSVYHCSRLDDLIPRGVFGLLTIMAVLVASAATATHSSLAPEGYTYFRTLTIAAVIGSAVATTVTVGLVIGAVALSPESVPGPPAPLRFTAASALFWPPVYSLAILIFLTRRRGRGRGSSRSWLWGALTATFVLGIVAAAMGVIYAGSCY